MQVALLLGLTTLFFTACKKSSSGGNTQYETLGTTNATNVSNMEATNNDVESMTELAGVIAIGSTPYYGQIGAIKLETDFDNNHWHHDGHHNGDDEDDFSHCAMIDFNAGLLSHTLTLDFGSSDCDGADGRKRHGQIIVTFSGNFMDSGSSRTITFNNYYINDNQLTGSKTITYMGTNSFGQPYYNIDVSDTLWLANTSNYISWDSHRTRTWIAGYTTYRRSDDVYLITGTAVSKQADGGLLHVDITTPLQVAPTCRWIEAGSITFTDQNNKTEVIDYGSGNCDSEAQLTVDGHVYNITLH